MEQVYPNYASFSMEESCRCEQRPAEKSVAKYKTYGTDRSQASHGYDTDEGAWHQKYHEESRRGSIEKAPNQETGQEIFKSTNVSQTVPIKEIREPGGLSRSSGQP